MTRLEKILIDSGVVEIVSGEGVYGTCEVYKGKLTSRAIKARLTRERCNGDRWAYIKIDGRKFDVLRGDFVD
jgi:hypothetical protein